MLLTMRIFLQQAITYKEPFSHVSLHAEFDLNCSQNGSSDSGYPFMTSDIDLFFVFFLSMVCSLQDVHCALPGNQQILSHM